MKGASPARCANRAHYLVCLTAGHALHLGLLLWPSLLLARPRQGLDLSVCCFAAGIATAALLESFLLRKTNDLGDGPIQDPVALRVARWVGIGLLMVFWLAQFERLVSSVAPPGIQLLGGFLLAGGVSLRWMAIRALGPRFGSDVRTHGARVSDRIYAVLRHPSEIGLLLLAAGGPLLLGSRLTAAAAIGLLLPTSLWRMRRENMAWSAQ